MKKYLFLIFCIFNFLNICLVMANENSGRWIDIEWDEVEGAKGYDIELFEMIDKKEFSRGIFHTEVPHWSKETPAGIYNVKIRALDSRKVPGAWGDAMPVAIKLMPTQLIRPLADEEFSTSEVDELTINFQWTHVQAAKFYQLVVLNSSNNIIVNQLTKDIEFKKSMSKIDSYKWFVIPLFSPDDKKSPDDFLNKDDDKVMLKKFSIKGQTLKSPLIDIDIYQDKGIVFKWKEIFRAKKYAYEVFLIEDNKNLKKILSAETDKHQIALKKDKFSKGKYIFSIKSESMDYKESESSKVTFSFDRENFEVISNESLSKEIMNRPPESSSFEGQFGYPSFNYTSRYYETDTSNQETLRGIRIQGKWRKNLSENRYQNIVKFEVSEAADSYTSATFVSMSESIGKGINYKNSNLYWSTGLRFDSSPIIYADRFSNQVLSKNIKYLSPEINIQYNFRFNPNWCSEIKSSVFIPFLSLANTNGSKIQPTMNYEAELKLIYTINGKFDFYSGVNHTSRELKTTAVTGANSFALNGDIDSMKLTATYLVFGTEFFY